MQLLEHVAKSALSSHDLPVPESIFVRKKEELSSVTDFPCVAKSQVPVGGRGKAGGIQVVESVEQLERIFEKIMNLEIKGYRPSGVLFEEKIEAERESYLALRLNRDARRVEVIASPHGGIEIEESDTPPTIAPLDDFALDIVSETLDFDRQSFEPLFTALQQFFFANDCLLLEINPLITTPAGELVIADAKIAVDDNAKFRHPELPWTDTSSNLRILDGNIGCIANGAGMAMSTMDTIVARGGHPANFLDIGGGTGEKEFVAALSTISNLPGVTSIIINIFAGISRCDEIARGIIAARAQIADLQPLFIRLEGTNRDEAVRLLDEASIAIEPSLASCIDKALEVAR
jgi:succinyl-CoA synthetase beta subunit